MEDGNSQADLSSFAQEIRAAETRAEKEDVLKRGRSSEVDESNKRKEVEFKATHGLLTALLVLILLVEPLHCWMTEKRLLIYAAE